jgi:site-specific DNA-methyltransferase (adenine-specific)
VNKENNTELFFETYLKAIDYLYDLLKLKYFDLFNLVSNELLNGEVSMFDEADNKALEEILSPLRNIDLTPEEIRKALQSLVLKGLKEEKINNGDITPDTIGYLFAYLISKFNNKDNIKILDPIAGFGNLLFTIALALDKSIDLYAIENNIRYIEVMKNISNLLQIETKIYSENTLTSNLSGMDFIVGDFNYYDLDSNGAYFPYETILHHVLSLKDEGIMIYCVPDDFFSFDKNQEFKKKLSENTSIIGLIELPDEMFNKDKKAILILQKKLYKDKKCLMVKLPSFNDLNEFNKQIKYIEAWFEKNINISEDK